MDGWVMRVGELLSPIVAAMGQELLEGDYIQADETPVGVQMHDGRGKSRQVYPWQYSRPEGSVVFDFRLGRKREGPKRFLGNFEGILGSGHAASAAFAIGGSKATAMAPMIEWADPESCMQAAGHTRGANFLMQLNSIPKIRPPLESWRRWTNFLPLMFKLELRN
jgi:hypothetical protein